MISLATLSQATPMQVFEQVRDHLLKQGVRSQKRDPMTPGGIVCVYRGPRNRMCAAGCLIAPEEYDEKMESRGWKRLVEEGIVPEDHAYLIMELQRIHDDEDPADWEHVLARVKARIKRGEFDAPPEPRSA